MTNIYANSTSFTLTFRLTHIKVIKCKNGEVITCRIRQVKPKCKRV